MPQGTQGRVEAIKARARRRSIVHVAQLHGVVTAQSAARCAADRTRAALSTNAVAAQGLTGGGGGGGGSAMLVPGSDASATAGAAADVAGPDSPPEPGRLQVHNLPMSRNAPSPRPRGCVHAGRAAIANVATLKAPVVPTGWASVTEGVLCAYYCNPARPVPRTNVWTNVQTHVGNEPAFTNVQNGCTFYFIIIFPP